MQSLGQSQKKSRAEKSLLAIAVGIKQKEVVNDIVKKVIRVISVDCLL